MGTREQAVRLSLLDSTAVCGKPHVRWCGRTDGRNPVSPTRSGLEISDTGPGIPEAERQRVFDRFYRREGSARAGSGLGLAIVKRIADAHGIKIDLSDSASETGLRMRFIFPHPGPKA